jgi:hypothetical protein
VTTIWVHHRKKNRRRQQYRVHHKNIVESSVASGNCSRKKETIKEHMPPAYFDFGIPFASNDFFEGFHIAGILYSESLFFF